MGIRRRLIEHLFPECPEYDCVHRHFVSPRPRIPWWLRRHGERVLYRPEHYRPPVFGHLSAYDQFLADEYQEALRLQLDSPLWQALNKDYPDEG